MRPLALGKARFYRRARSSLQRHELLHCTEDTNNATGSIEVSTNVRFPPSVRHEKQIGGVMIVWVVLKLIFFDKSYNVKA